jgi:hypothetical protein
MLLFGYSFTIICVIAICKKFVYAIFFFLSLKFANLVAMVFFVPQLAGAHIALHINYF